MLYKKIKLFFTLLFFGGLIATNAQQQYPVQVTHQMLPPYSLRLSDYVTSQSTRLRVNLLMTDINVSNRQVKLKLHLKGNGIDAHSTDNVIGAPTIFLDGGALRTFTNIDLSAYFDIKNLKGITQKTYSGLLPDGAYQICWEVYDFFTGEQISNPNLGCANVYLFLNDPPFLNSPTKNQQILEQNPTNIVFQWTPRHVNATNVSYEFELREVWDNRVDPQAAFLSSTNYHSETTKATALVYNMSKPALIPGKRYAWRVRVKSTDGVTENALFKNNGQSEIFCFTYVESCKKPMFVLANPISSTSVKIQWQGYHNHKQYHVQYKRKDISDAEWFSMYSYNHQVQVGNLKPGKSYLFRVGASCNNLAEQPTFTYSSPSIFTLSEREKKKYTCGVVPEIKIENTKPLKNLGVNEVFTAGDFSVTVKEVEGGNGNYTGKGYIVVPYLGDTKIAVVFSGISINEEYQLTDGILETTYDPTWGGVENTATLTQGGDGKVVTKNMDFPIKDVVKKPDGTILVVGESGEVVELPKGEDYIIISKSKDKKKQAGKPATAVAKQDETVYHVDEEGNITKLKGKPSKAGSSSLANTNGVDKKGDANALAAKDVIVTFSQHPESKYGFDNYNPKYPATASKYRKLSDDYYIAYQAVPKGKSVKVIADIRIKGKKIKPKDILFRTKQGVGIATTADRSDPNKRILELKGTLSDAEIEIQAIVKGKKDKYEIAGALMMYQANMKQVKVALVNNTNANTSSLKAKVKAIYQQAMVDVVFEKDISDFRIGADQIESGDSGFGAQYTAQQRTINQRLMQRPDYKEDVYYLFLTNAKPSSSGEKGLMPLGRQFGYIYKAAAKTIAHELGHGVFMLKHPFSNKSFGFDLYATNWMMDYGEMGKIPFVHWKEMHNPKVRIGIFDKDSEAELAGVYWFAPDWRVIKVDDAKKVVYSKTAYKKAGTVPGFTLYGKQYLAKYNNGKFQGYFHGQQDIRDVQDIYQKDVSRISDIYLYIQEDGCGKYVKKKFNSVKSNIINGKLKTAFIKKGKLVNIGCSNDEFKTQTAKDFYETHKLNATINKSEVRRIAELIDELDENVLKEYNNKALESMPSSFLSYYYKWSANKKDYLAYRKGLEKFIETFKSKKEKIKTLSDPEKMMLLASGMLPEQLKSLSLDHKVKMLQVISEGKLLPHFYFIGKTNHGEDIALSLLQSIKLEEANDFIVRMSKLRSKDNKNLVFLSLYSKINNQLVAKNNNTAFLNILYKLWLVSDYSDEEKSLSLFKYGVGSPPMINYSPNKFLGFYIDYQGYDFSYKKERILVEIPSPNPESYNVFNEDIEKITYGIYDIFQPVQLVSIGQSELNIAKKLIPLFYLKEIKDRNRFSNIMTGANLGFDVVTTFTGIGNLSKLRHLSKLKKIGKIIISGLEISSGVTSMLIDYTSVCKDNEQACENIQTYLFWVEMASLSGDAISTAMLKKNAKKAVKDGLPVALEKEAKDQIKKHAGVVNAVDDVLETAINTFKKDFPSNWRYNKIADDAYEIVDGTGKKWGTFYKDKIVASGRTVKGARGNPVLNKVPLAKNMKYEVDGFIYQTDDLGRVVTTNADLDDIARIRLGNQQIRAVDIKDGIKGSDQGGHIVASRFFGPGEQINMYPQSGTLNQGAWKEMENLWAREMVTGKDVKIQVKAIFDGTSKRPTKFKVQYTIDGQPFNRSFNN